MDSTELYQLPERDYLNASPFSPRILEVSNRLGPMVFNSLLQLEPGVNTIEEILARYERQGIIERFDTFFALFLSIDFVLTYSYEEIDAFYIQMCGRVPLAEYIDVFKKGTFAKSFVAEMYRFSGPLFISLSTSEQESYRVLQKKHPPIDPQELHIVNEILLTLTNFEQEKLYRRKGLS